MDQFLPLKVSKVSWKNINMIQLLVKGSYTFYNHIYVQGSGSYAWILSGKNTIKSLHDNILSDLMHADTEGDGAAHASG